MALGSTLLFQGKLDPAFAHFRRGFETFDPNMQFLDWPGSHPAMEFFRSRLSRVESDAMVYRIKALFNEQGFGLWATEVPDVARFIGFSGLAVADFRTVAFNGQTSSFCRAHLTVKSRKPPCRQASGTLTYSLELLGNRGLQ